MYIHVGYSWKQEVKGTNLFKPVTSNISLEVVPYTIARRCMEVPYVQKAIVEVRDSAIVLS